MDTATIITKLGTLNSTADQIVTLVNSLKTGPDAAALQQISDTVDQIQGKLGPLVTPPAS